MKTMPPEMVAEMRAAHLTPNQMRAAWNNYDAHFSEGQKAGIALERKRIETILCSPLAKTHPAMAEKLAFQTELDSSAALTLLGSVPAPPPKAANRLELAIAAAGGSPNVGSEFGAPGEDAESVATVAARIASY